MKILLTHRYFWPDFPPYGLMLRSIAEGLRDDGHTVTIFSSNPSYNSKSGSIKVEEINGLKVSRNFAFSETDSNMFTRLINSMLYCFGLFVHVLRTRPEVVTAATFPPVIAAWVASLSAKIVGAKFIYHVQDIHPEVSKYSGGVLGSKLIQKILVSLDNQTLRRASSIIVLSQNMADTLLSRGIKNLPIRIINNFSLEEFSNDKFNHEELIGVKSRKRIIFAGNLGRFQNLDTLTKGIVKYLNSDPSTELVFLGDGLAAKELHEKWAKHSQIKFLPYLPYAQAKAIIETADIGLVAIRKNIFRVSYPSKVLTYLGLKIPIFVLIERDSALAELVLSEGLGAVPDASDAQSVALAIGELMANLPTKEHIADWHEKNATASVAVAAWKRLLLEDL